MSPETLKVWLIALIFLWGIGHPMMLFVILAADSESIDPQFTSRARHGGLPFKKKMALLTITFVLGWFLFFMLIFGTGEEQKSPEPALQG